MVQEERGAIVFKVVKGAALLGRGVRRGARAFRQYLGEEMRIDVEFVEHIEMVRTGKRLAMISKLSIDFQKLQYPEGPKV